jgi:hypothetical protein
LTAAVNLKARVYLFPVGHGGRTADFRGSTARVGIVFPNDDRRIQFGGEIRTDGEELRLGEFLWIDIALMNALDAHAYIRDEGDFRIFEGARLIGVGLWGFSRSNA